MRSRICLQCNIFIKASKGWKSKTYRRLGGVIHEECLDIYNKHRHALAQLRYKRRLKLNKVKPRTPNPEYDRNYYLKNKTRINKRYKDKYYEERDKRLEYAKKQYDHKRKNILNETDDVYMVKVL